MNWISKNEWKPADGFELEVEAMNTVNEDVNTLVVAGPGAGKTELLAQRASFLLETNTCKYPRRILAISFKKDAATNLKERVELRCGKELSSRFESKTYDAYAKEILDRFVDSIYESYRPNKGYKIASNDEIRKAFINSGLHFSGNQREFNRLYANRLSIHKLPLTEEKVDQVFINAWNMLLKGNKENSHQCFLTFDMISRLAEYLIRTNNYIRKSIIKTYTHVFLDEFQDTTTKQYDLVKACFYDTKTIITAVGDSKQRIMLWAGARKTIFDDFLNDFTSMKRTLLMNHRSAPRLVEIQKSMYNRLNEESISIQTNKKWDADDGEAFLRMFDNHLQEAEVIRDEIQDLIDSGVELRDICIVVKQRVDVYGEEIIKQLASINIKARNEAIYQDLVKEEIICVLISMFKLTTKDRQPNAWEYFYDIMSELNGIDSDSDIKRITDFTFRINNMLENLKLKLDIYEYEQFCEMIDNIIEEISYDSFASKFQQYQSKEHFDDLIIDFKELLWKEFLEVENWAEAIDNFEGKNSVPIMTIHKSKGLEYDTVFFVGLEDSAFWNFKNQPDEDRCAFFVGLSRAKRRIDFTFSKNRPAGFSVLQVHRVINEFYEMFEDTGIVTRIDYGENN